MGHENAEGMAHVGVRVEPPVRLGHVGTVVEVRSTHDFTCAALQRLPIAM